MNRWRVFRNNGRGVTEIVSENLPRDAAHDLVESMNKLKNGMRYFCDCYEEARQTKAHKPHIVYSSVKKWVCSGAGRTGFGSNPMIAFRAWLEDRRYV